MKALMDKLFKPKKTKLFWMYFIVGALALIAGIMLMPVWPKDVKWIFWASWGMQAINLIIAACLIIYLVLFLLKKVMKRQNGVVLVLTIVEFILLGLIALGCILQQFKVINIAGACQILGVVLWCRGVVEVFRAYFHQKGNNEKYPIWWLVIALVFITFGVTLYWRPLFQDVTVLWCFVILILLVGALCIADGFLAKPASKKSKK